jgi:voltage-gated potassium channel
VAGRKTLTAKPEHRLQRFEKRTEWPLAIAATMFLAAYSVEVIGQPTGGWARALDLVMVITWALFVVDYAARLYLAPHRSRWFVRHLLDLAIVALPLLRPLRLLRLVVLLAALQKAIGGAIRGRVIVYTASVPFCSSTRGRWRYFRPKGRIPAPGSPRSAMPCGGR